MPNFYGRMGIQFTDTMSAVFDELADATLAICTEAVLEAGEIIRAAAFEKANVSKGVRGHGRDGEHMRDEIKVTVYEYESGVSARIGIDLSVIPYAPHQEFGPRGKPFLRPAIDENREACHEKMREVLADGLIHGARTKVRFRSYA